MNKYLIQDYFVTYGIGKAKYVLNYYKGNKHTDGSRFYDIRIFKNKKALNNFINNGIL